MKVTYTIASGTYSLEGSRDELLMVMDTLDHIERTTRSYGERDQGYTRNHAATMANALRTAIYCYDKRAE